MNRSKIEVWILILVAGVMLSGCAIFNGSAISGEEINQHIQSRHFQLAREALIRQEPFLSESQIVAWQTLIADEQRSYINKILIHSKRLWQSNEFGRAHRLLSLGLEKTGSAKRLRTRHKEYSEAIATMQNDLDREGMMNEAQWLSRENKRLTRQLNLRSSPSLIQELSRIQARSHILGETLYSLGTSLQKAGDRMLAYQVIALASELGQEDAEQYITQINQHQLFKVRRKAEHLSQQQSQALSFALDTKTNLIAKLDVAINQNKLEVAAAIMAQLKENYPDSQELPTYQQRLTNASDQRVTTLFNEGNRFYALGQFEDALSKWQQILVLQPSNVDAKNLLSRTNKVIKNLQLLSKSDEETLILSR